MIEPNQIRVVSRGQELLRMLALGCSNKEIASFLNVSPRTVKEHLRTLFLELLLKTKTAPIPGLAAERHGREEPQPAPAAAVPKPKAIGYGLPCSHCHAYYHADMHVCPICKSPERVPPNSVPALSVVPAMRTPEPSIATSLAASSHP